MISTCPALKTNCQDGRTRRTFVSSFVFTDKMTNYLMAVLKKFTNIWKQGFAKRLMVLDRIHDDFSMLLMVK